MSILDEAIREHLELKRQHGADDSELKQLEDEAFGPAERPGAEEQAPDPSAEAPTEFMTQPPEVAEALEESAVESVEGSRRDPSPGLADLQEAPPAPAVEAEPADDEPAVEEQPAMEYETIPEPSAGEHSTEERHAIAEQPTELFDVEGEIAASESRSPTDEELVEEEINEPRLAPVDPLAGLEDVEEDEVSVEVDATAEDVAGEEEDFFDEQRLSDELDQALEAPAVAAPVELEPAPEVEEDEEDVFEEDEDQVEELAEDADTEGHGDEEQEDPPTGDVLGGTPDFLEEAPEDDQLWFEQKPPKDFDFDD